jgi:hypothetical protein
MTHKRFLFFLLCLLTTVALCIVSRRSASVGTADAESNRLYANEFAARPSPTGAQPAADVRSQIHDFGIVEPNRTYQFKFPIRNTGQGPLKLSKEMTTSSAISMHIDPHTLLPGKTGDIIIDWDAYLSDADFCEHAVLATSDPARPTIDFELRGKTLVLLAAEPPVLRAPYLDAVKGTKLETDVASPYWRAFTLEVHPSLPGIDYTMEPLGPMALDKLKVRSGWHLVVTLPADLPPGAVKEKLTLIAHPQFDAPMDEQFNISAMADVERELPIEGKVPSRLVVYGNDIDEFGTIEAGTVTPRRGYRGTFTVKVNDPEPRLGIKYIEAAPDLIEARLEPDTSAGARGIYRLSVQIPPSEVAVACVGKDQGKLTIAFDHPRIEILELGVEFIVLNSVR